MPFLNHTVPSISCLLRMEYMFNHEQGHGKFIHADIHTVASICGRVPLFEALIENGVNWTRRPITAFCWKEDAPIHPLEVHCYWDCFSHYIDVSVRHRLSGLSATLIDIHGKQRDGDYMFTIDWASENPAMVDPGFSETAEHKCGHFFKMEDGNFFIYPNNRIIWRDVAFIHDRLRGNPGYKIDNNIYSVESRIRKETDWSYNTQYLEP